MELTDIAHANTNSRKLKGGWKFLGWAWSKNHQSGDGTRKLTVSERWKDGINWFFACWYRFTKIKNWSKKFWVGIAKNVRGQSGHWTLKLTVSQKLTDGINWFFACWYKFRKAKNLIQWFLGGRGQKWSWSFSSWDPEI